MISKFINFIKTRSLYFWIIGFVIGVGIFLRTLFFSYGRPLWNDECALALNIINLNNFFVPLSYNQSAPQLFAYLSKMFYTVFSDKTFALRIIPFVSSILSIFVFYKLSSNVLEKKLSVLFAVTVFSACYPLCYYAQEFKQYSSDVLIFLLILLSYFYIEKITNTPAKMITYTIVSVLLLWSSFVSNFALATLVVCLFFFKRKVFNKMLIPFIIIFINIILFGLANFYLHSNSYLYNYWAEGFINKGFYNFLLLNIKNIKYAFNTGLPLFFIVLSFCLMLVKNLKNEKTFIILLPLFLSLLLSYFEIYPYLARVILFLIPIFILLLAKIIDFINFKNHILNNIIITILCIVVLLPISLDTYDKILQRNYAEENIINPLSIAVKEAKKDDVIYISDGNEILYNYYKIYFNIKNPVFVEQKRYNYNNEYIKVLDNLEPGKTYFWIMAHHPAKFERIDYVYAWAKNKKDFQIYVDKKGNALIKFSL